MNAKHFQLTSQWMIAAPIDLVWQQLSRPERWPEWWPAVLAVQTLSTGDSSGVGAIRRMHWRTALPYRLSFNMFTTRVEKHRLIEGESDGELAGVGRWQFTREREGTRVQYDWTVNLGKPWMRIALPILRPLFTWNHNKVMEWGREGLCQRVYFGVRNISLPASLIERYSRLQ